MTHPPDGYIVTFRKVRMMLIEAFAVSAMLAAPVQASTYSDRILSLGPVAYWRLGETSGTTAIDTTGIHNGTYQNSVTLGSNGAILSDTDKAANFGGGANDRVQVSPFGISGTGLTILAWFKADTFGNDHLVSKANGTATANFYWALGINGSSRMIAWVKIGGTTRQLSCPVSTMATNKWYFAAVTYNGNTIRVFRNGVQVGTASYAGTVTTDSSVAVALGNLPAGVGDRAFDGVLDEVAIFNKALTPAEIYELYTLAGDGLIANWKLRETSGTTASDSSPQQNHGTYINGVLLGAAGPYPGAGSKAANFDGTNDYVSIPNENLYDLTGPMTVAAWIKVDQFHVAEQAIVTKGNNAWRLQRAGSTNRLNFRCERLSPNSLDSAVDINDGLWHHVAGVYTGSQLQIYIDGILNNSVNATGTIQTNNREVQIARNSQGAARPFDGSIHDVRIYDRALTPAEIAELYGLIGYWKLDETSGSVAADSSGSSRHGSVIGTSTWTQGVINNAFQLNGANRIQVPGLMNYPTSVSLAAWADLTAADSGGAEIVSIGDCFRLRLDERRVSRASFYNGSAWVALTLPQTFARTGWHHFAVIFNNDDDLFELYVDGAPATSLTTSSTISYFGQGANTVIGAHGNGRTNRDFTGRLDEIRIYNRPISPSEVQALFGGGSPIEGVRIIKWVEIQ